MTSPHITNSGTRTLKQCKKCPWRLDVDPHDIPNGYCEAKHAALESTISDGRMNLSGELRMMACHESPVGKEAICAGWFANQVGPGNNMGLRMWAIQNKPEVKLVSEQHQRFKDTLP